jgi:hypothetical protein
MKKLVLSVLVFIYCSPMLAQPASTPAGERLKSLQQMQLLERHSVVNTIPFRNIGPSIMGGRVIDLAVNEENPIEFYVAYSSGGIWYTKNNGQSFIPVSDSLPVMTIGCIAVNWKKGIIWVGTGDNIGAYEGRPGIGVFKSVDWGKTWQYLGLPESHHITKILLHPANENIAWVAVMGHFKSTNKERGLYETIDGGKTWKQSLYIDDTTGITDVVMNPQHPNELFSAAWHYLRNPLQPIEHYGNSCGIYKTSNEGVTWSLITTAASGFPRGKNIGRIGIGIYSKNPKILYAIVDNKGIARRDTFPAIRRTKYDWTTFKNISGDQFENLNDSDLNDFLKHYQFLLQQIPTDAKVLKQLARSGLFDPKWIYNQFINRGYDKNGFQTYMIYERHEGSQIFMSINGGLSWQQKGINLQKVAGGWDFCKMIVFPSDSSKLFIQGIRSQVLSNNGNTLDINNGGDNVHPDHHACWINPNNENHIIIGTDAGCNITYDGGRHWLKLNVPGMGVAQCYSVAVDNAQPYNVFLATQDNGIWMGPSDNEESYQWFANGNSPFKEVQPMCDGTGVFVDNTRNPTVYYMDLGSHITKVKRDSLSIRKGNAATYEDKDKRAIDILPPFGQKFYRTNWTTPLLISSHNPKVIYIGRNFLCRSLNEGDTVVAISPDLTNGEIPDVEMGTITAIAESSFRFGLLYVGTDDGNIQLSPDGGYTWQLISKNIVPGHSKGGKTLAQKIPKPLRITSLIASKFKESRVYAAMSGYYADDLKAYLFVSEDYGKTWNQLGSDLPYECINVIKEDPKDGNILYAGTDGGLYVSLDRGKSFMSWNAGLPKGLIVNDIAIQERENEIVLGTWGRSIYIASLKEIQTIAAKQR